MEVGNSKNSTSILNGDSNRGLQNGANRSGNQVVEDKVAFGDAARVDITDFNENRAQGRELSAGTGWGDPVSSHDR